MPNIQGSGAPRSISVTGLSVTTANTITNYTVTAANSEESVTLPADVKRFKLKARGTAVLKISYNSGETSSNYWTLYPGSCLEEDRLDVPSLTIYLQSSKSGEVVEITTWT